MARFFCVLVIFLPPNFKQYLKMAKTKHFDFLLSIRKNLLTYLDNLTPEQLGYIPIGFSNNIFWNIAHCIAVQQFLCYQLSGNKLLISNDFLEKYNRGTFPQKIAPSKEKSTK